jgi:hypothetical protein
MGLLGDVETKRRCIEALVGGNGGDDGIRTHDLCSAIAALSQLSYIPRKANYTLARL